MDDDAVVSRRCSQSCLAAVLPTVAKAVVLSCSHTVATVVVIAARAPHKASDRAPAAKSNKCIDNPLAAGCIQQLGRADGACDVDVSRTVSGCVRV